MVRPVLRSALSLALVISQALVPLPAFAQTDEQRAAARDLASEGADAFDAGRYQDAIDRFTRAESLVHAMPHLLFLARSHAKLQQFVKAREAYIRIINETLPPNASRAAKEAQANAQSEISSVEGKIGRLTIQVKGKEQAKDLSVTVNGVPVPSVLVGAPQPIDPGDHKVEAVATGFRAEPTSVTIGEGERKEIVLTLVSDPNAAPPVVAGAAPAAAAAPGATTAPATPTNDPAPPSDQGTSDGGSNGMRIGSYVAFGVGAVGLGLGTVFLIQSSSKRSEADDLCTLPGGGCDQANESKVNDLDDQADSAGTLGVVGLVVGAIGVATGVTLLVLSSGRSNEESSVAGGGGAGAPAHNKRAAPPNNTKTAVRVAPWFGRETVGIKGTF